MLGRVLVGTDGSAEAIEAAHFAAAVAGEAGLTLVSVASEVGLTTLIGLDAASAALGGVSSDLGAEFRRSRTAEAREAIDRTRAALDARLPVDTRLVFGHATDAILDLCEEGQHDMVVVGTRGLGRASRALLGSVSDRVLRHAPCVSAIGRIGKAQRFVLAIDGSDAAFRAAAWVGRVTAGHALSVDLCHVIEPPRRHPSEDDVWTHRRVRPWFDLARRRVGSATVSESVVRGDPVESLMDQAQRTGADTIVCGRHGNTPHRRWFVGSVALRIASESPVNVVIVP